MRRAKNLDVISAAVLACSSFAHAGTPATYTGPNQGVWSVAANWSGGVVPNASTFDVTIPGGVSVFYDLTAPSTIESLSGSGGLALDRSTSLTVTGNVSGLYNIYNGGGTFASTSTQPGAADYVAIQVAGGGTSTFNTSSYTVGNGQFNGYGTVDMLSASGSNSLLNLSSLSTITVNVGFNCCISFDSWRLGRAGWNPCSQWDQRAEPGQYGARAG